MPLHKTLQVFFTDQGAEKLGQMFEILCLT